METFKLTVSKEFKKRCAVFFEMNPELQGQIIESGLKAYQTVLKRECQNSEIMIENEKQRIENEYYTQLDLLENKNKTLEKTIKNLQKDEYERIMEDRLLQKEINNDRELLLTNQLKELERIYQDQLNDLKLRNKNLIERSDVQLSQREDYYRKEIKKQEEMLQEMRLENKKLLTKDRNNKIKGAEGENYILGYLNKHFGKYEITKVCDTKHGGDIRLVIDNKTILIEIRNYQNSVSLERRQTLIRDVLEQDSDGGILVSLHSGVVGKKDMEIDVTKEGKVLVFCHNVWNELDKLKGAIYMICRASSQINDFGVTERNEFLEILEKSREKLRSMNTHIQGLDTLRRDFQQSHQKLISKLSNDNKCVDNNSEIEKNVEILESNQGTLDVIEMEDYNKMTVKELKTLLRKKHQLVKGNKTELIKRLINL